jgi:predicted nicotinamide N-methyase
LINEAKNILGSGPNVGLRTWEASLRLSTYLYQNQYLICDRNILELGAGTGFLSLFCSFILNAKQVIATDGNENVLQSLRDNIELNASSFPGMIRPIVRTLSWESHSDIAEALSPIPVPGSTLSPNPDDAMSEPNNTKQQPFIPDLILGADLTYHPAACEVLASLLSALLSHIQSSQLPQTTQVPTTTASTNNTTPTPPEIILATTHRAAQTHMDFFNTLRNTISGINIEEIGFDCPVEKQRGLFHSVYMEIRLWRIWI